MPVPTYGRTQLRPYGVENRRFCNKWTVGDAGPYGIKLDLVVAKKGKALSPCPVDWV